GRSAAKNWPRPKVVEQSAVKLTTNAAIEPKRGRQRAAIHSSSGNSRTPGTMTIQGASSRNTANQTTAESTASATRPSMSSRLGGGSRIADARPITNGATATTPTAYEANQSCQIARAGYGEPRKYTWPAVPPIPETAALTAVAAISPNTWRRLLRRKFAPK